MGDTDSVSMGWNLRFVLNLAYGVAQNSHIRVDQWRHRRRNLYLHNHLHWVWIGCSLHGGNGIDVWIAS